VVKFDLTELNLLASALDDRAIDLECRTAAWHLASDEKVLNEELDMTKALSAKLSYIMTQFTAEQVKEYEQSRRGKDEVEGRDRPEGE